MLKLHKDTKTYIIDKALTHIKGVEKNPDQTFDEDGDNFDYWNSVPLNNGRFIDYNIHEANFGEDSDDYEWFCSAYDVDEPNEENEYHQINTDVTKLLLKYKDGEIKYYD